MAKNYSSPKRRWILRETQQPESHCQPGRYLENNNITRDMLDCRYRISAPWIATNGPWNGVHMTANEHMVACLVYRWSSNVLLISQEITLIMGTSESEKKAEHHSEEPVPPNYSQMAAEHGGSLYMFLITQTDAAYSHSSVCVCVCLFIIRVIENWAFCS